MTQLSPHFALKEFTSSQIAARLGRSVIPEPHQLANLQRLCTSMLEPLRMKLQRPIVITSGLRPDWLNAAIGGAKNSAHVDGRAADIKVVGMMPVVFSQWVRLHAAEEGWPLDQCILEFPPDGWTHLAIADKPRHQYLTARSVGGRTVYSEGISA